MGFPRYFWHCFLIPGLVMLAGAVADGVSTWNVQKSLARTQGTVLRIVSSGKLRLDFSAEIQFATPDGDAHVFSTQLTYSGAVQPGRRVTVVYNIDDPTHASIEMKTPNPWEGTLLLLAWGGAISLLGGLPIYFAARKAKQIEWLKLNGRAVDAVFAGVYIHKDLIVNGKSPYRISARWQDLNFHSDNLWTDPASHIKSKTIPVIMDPDNPKRYWMDLSFLPRPD